MDKKIYTIDATDKTLGRVASQAAKLLRGKNEVTFERHLAPNIKVVIANTSKAKITDRKMREKVYDHYSGYPGGYRTETMADLARRKGVVELFRVAVHGMIPNNKLRSIIMKRLTVTE